MEEQKADDMIPFEYLKKVFQRDKDGGTSDDAHGKMGKPLGWFATVANPAFGWVVYEIDDADKTWFKSQGESMKGVFRTLSGKLNTKSIVKIDLKKGNIYFFNTKEYEDTDQITWEKRPVKFSRFFIDYGMQKNFNVI